LTSDEAPDIRALRSSKNMIAQLLGVDSNQKTLRAAIDNTKDYNVPSKELIFY